MRRRCRVRPPRRSRPKYQVWELTLYVAGRTPASQAAIGNLQKLCSLYLIGRYRIQIVDLAEQPERARKDQVVATPMLVRRAPRPVRRIVGDLSDSERVLTGLQVVPEERSAAARRPRSVRRAARELPPGC